MRLVLRQVCRVHISVQVGSLTQASAPPHPKMSSLQGLRRSLVCSIPTRALRFTTSSTLRANRAIYFEKTGDPSHVLSALTFPSLPAPPSGSVNVRFRLSPINPSDVNVVEGVYPSKPSGTQSLAEGHSLDNSIYVPGNEGLAEVTDVGSGVAGLQRGDWVVLSKQQGGTWASARTIAAEDVVKVPTSLSEVNAATITVGSVVHSYQHCHPHAMCVGQSSNGI